MTKSEDSKHDGMFLDLPIDIRSIEDARLALLEYLAPYKLCERSINLIEVVLEELLSNVVRHACNAHLLTVEAHWRKRILQLTVQDDGPAFNPILAAAPRQFVSVQDAQLGGQGIALVRKLSRSVSYERTDKFNRITALLEA